MSLLRLAYKLGSVYWTTRALRRGRLPQREARRLAYRASGRIIRRLFR